MAKPIVVAVDGSEESLRAAEWAAREAMRWTAPLRIVSAPGVLPRSRTYQAPAATVANALRGIAARALAGAVDRVSEVTGGLLVDTELIGGPPAVAVCRSGEGARLLVVGARGVGGFAALVLGSVSRYVASHAPCPIAVVHEETEAVHRQVLVGVHDPDCADAALGFAFEEAALRRADLVVVHAIWLPFGGQNASSSSWHLAPLAAAAHEAEAAARRHLGDRLDQWRRKFPEVAASPDVLRGHPAHLLAGLSARADLVVIGRHDTDSGPGSSAVQHSVLGHAHSPVAIVPSVSLG